MKKYFNLEEENQIISNITSKNMSVVIYYFLMISIQLNFFNNFFQTSFKTSKYLIENQKKNILYQPKDDTKPIEEEKILLNIQNVNKEISDKYANLINKYYEIVIHPFNVFTSELLIFFSFPFIRAK